MVRFIRDGFLWSWETLVPSQTAGWLDLLEEEENYTCPPSARCGQISTGCIP